MEDVRESKEFKAMERALLKRLKVKLDPSGEKKVKPDFVVKDFVRRYMDAWAMAEDARKDIAVYGQYCLDDRGRRYGNPSMKSLRDAESLMESLQKSMDIKTEDLAATMGEDDEL